jgi:lipid kinase YegS
LVQQHDAGACHLTETARRSLRVILNGKAASDPAVQEAFREIRGQGHRIDMRVTEHGGDATRFAAESAAAGFDLTVAAGGDGTVNEVVNGLMTGHPSVRTALAVMPVGTANDFARACDIPLNDPAQSLRLAVQGRPRYVDVGQVNDRFFINGVSAGFGAEAAARTPETLKKTLGPAAYPLTGIATAAAMTRHAVRIISDQAQWQEEMIHMAVGNSRFTGGGISLTPKALLDDGLLDLVLVRAASAIEFAALAAEMTRIGEPENRYILYMQMASFRIELAEPTSVNVDGEPIDAHLLAFRVHPRRLPVVLPPEVPMLTRPVSA